MRIQKLLKDFNVLIVYVLNAVLGEVTLLFYHREFISNWSLLCNYLNCLLFLAKNFDAIRGLSEDCDQNVEIYIAEATGAHNEEVRKIFR